MSKRTATILMATCAAVFSAAVTTFAQWERGKTPGIPRRPDGTANLSAALTYTSDGKPDLSGVWIVSQSFVDGVPKYARNLAADLEPAEAPSLQPWAKALMEQRMGDLGKEFPPSRCLPPGVPLIDAIPAPFKIVQTPELTVILYEGWTIYRQIFIDGRELPKDPNPAWMGYSVGHWEGDTLVVSSGGFNDRSWLDLTGHPHTEALHVVERFRRRNFGNLEIQITIDDPMAYRKPWTVTENAKILPDDELIEFICNENEKDLEHLVGR
jgi:hypothetical protein